MLLMESESWPLNAFVTSSYCFFSLFWVTHQVSHVIDCKADRERERGKEFVFACLLHLFSFLNTSNIDRYPLTHAVLECIVGVTLA